MKAGCGRKSVSGLRWAGKRWLVTERKVIDTIREAMLLSASLMLVLLKIMKTAPPGLDVEALHRPDSSLKESGERQSPVR
jgi:hypothetical protein